MNTKPLTHVLTILIIVSMTTFSFSQNISGVLNTYDKVIEANTCAAFIRVENANTFAVQQRLIIIQMQGATISTADNGTYGTIQQMNGAGQWEVITIESIVGDTLFLDYSLVQDFDTDAAVQVVDYPELDDAEIIDTLQALPWDGSIGGIIAFTANSIDLQAPIDASNVGFRGGANVNHSDNGCSGIFPETDYYYDGNNWRGARKGEGLWINNTNNPAGRGAPANGGGGGNDHNSGGGGGANPTSGGRGGENLQPGLFNCHGYYPGIGGHAIDYSLQRLYLGGGGGAGHGNNDNGTPGGNGGGIIIISSATTINFNGHLIQANGQNSASTQGDGAGGGGAGGTIYLDVANDIDMTSIQLQGGVGGNVNNNNQDRCQGPGGGGGGGLLVTNQMIGANLDGGTAGLGLNSTVNDCTAANIGAGAGQNGFQANLYSPLQNNVNLSNLSATIQGDLLDLCPTEIYTLTLDTEGTIDNYQWQYSINGTDWINLPLGTYFSGTTTDELTITNMPSDFDILYVRCALSNDCGFEAFTPLTPVLFEESIFANFEYSIDGSIVDFTNLSSVELWYTYQWDFGDETTSSEFEPDHFYDFSGSYLVVLTVDNGCEMVTFSETITIESNIQISWDNTNLCAPTTLQFGASVDGDTYSWTFEGGSPATSNESHPMVDYFTPGDYDVTVIVDGSIQSYTDSVHIYQTPNPNFDFAIDGTQVTFTNTSIGGTDFIWDFGDGSDFSMEVNPVHVYTGNASYIVTLQALDGPCSIIISQNIGNISPIINWNFEGDIELFPNPFKDQLTMTNPTDKPLHFKVTTPQGKQLFQDILKDNKMLDFKDYASGIYFIFFTDKDQKNLGYYKLVKQ